MSDPSRQVPRRPRPRKDVVFRQLADEWVLFDPQGRRLHVMNLTAALVWSHCDGRRGLPEIASAVREAFPDPPPEEELRFDVAEALGALAEKDLLREGDEQGSPDGGEA